MNTIDELMSRNPLELTAKDIDDIIAHHREHRANLQSGFKPAKEKGPKVEFKLADLGLVKPKPTAEIKRRI